MSLPSPSCSKTLWKTDLYKIQLDALNNWKPKPICQTDQNVSDSKPSFYGAEYWGLIDHKESEKLLKEDGEYLVRKSPGSADFYTLSMRFDNKTKHYKIYYNPSYGHYLKEDFKRFESLHDLVLDGLVCFYMQKYASPIIQQMMSQTKTCYQQSPYMTLNRRKLRAISNEMRKSLKLQEVIDNNCNIETSESITNDDEKEPLLMKDEETLIEISTPTAIENNNFTVTSNSFQDDTNDLPIVYEKHHAFKIHNFKGLNWCEYCANFLWGLVSQGVKCEDCGFVAHKKCSELIPNKCVPVLKRIRGIFGKDLTTIVSAHKCYIPFVVKKCVEEVEVRGLMQEGIYRISGFADEIEALKLALDKDGEKTDMSETAYSNINVIAGTLKLYLRLLPIPLITFQSYPDFLEATKKNSEEEMIAALKESTKSLPQPHLNCLKYIIQHLNRVASFKNINKMSEYNLATVFAPTLIGTSSNPQNLTDMSQEIHILSELITNCSEVFAS